MSSWTACSKKRALRTFLATFLFLALATAAHAHVTVTLATGGGAISADTTNATFTSLAGPSITEQSTGDINEGTIIIAAPSGFAFDTGPPTIMVQVIRVNGTGSNSRNINNVANGTLLNVTVTTTQITFTVTDETSGNVQNKLDWQNIRVRPAAGTPLARGNLTKMGTSLTSGLPNGTALGELVEVVGVLADIGISPTNAVINQGQNQTYTAAGYDTFGNLRSDVTASTVFSITPAAGGGWAANTYTSSASGTWSVTGTFGNFSDNVLLVVRDITPPVITVLGTNPAIVEGATTYVDAGATAFDNYHGNITGAIITTNPVNTFVLGAYMVTYRVNDSSGNNATATRTVQVVDTTQPTITRLGSSPVTIEAGTNYTDAGATAVDTISGNLTAAITVTNTVNINIPGTYIVTYRVNDSSGNNATATRTVNVVDTTRPVITVLGNSSVVVEGGSAYVDAGATAYDNMNGNITGAISVVNPVNTTVPGTYLVRYLVNDSSGNNASANRTVRVVDTTAPNLTMLGANPLTISGEPYQEPGATAYDLVDGSRTSAIVILGARPTPPVGTMTVIYVVNDSAGNIARAERTVVVLGGKHRGLGPEAHSYFSKQSAPAAAQAAPAAAPSIASTGPQAQSQTAAQSVATESTPSRNPLPSATVANPAPTPKVTGAVTKKVSTPRWHKIAALGTLLVALGSALAYLRFRRKY